MTIQYPSLERARLATAGFSILAAITACSGGTAIPQGVGGAVTQGSGGDNSNGGNAQAGGQIGNGGQTGNGGNTQAGGQTGNGGATGIGGATGNGGNAQVGGASTGGAVSNGGNTSTGGKANGGSSNGGTATGGSATGGKAAGGATVGGATATTGGKATGGTVTTSGGTTAAGGAATGGATAVSGCGTQNKDPFSCKFGWGAPSSGTNYSYLNFVSTWIGDETNAGLGSWSATGTNSGASSQSACGDCALVQTVAGTNSMVAFYAYIIGFQACKQAGFCDCNTSGGTTLCTNGAAWIKANRAQIIQAYGQYAKAVYAKSPNKGTIWMLEGDFIQYTYTADQTSALTYAEAGQLTRDITCAIKSNQPNAIVGMNHSPWIANDVATAFWGAMPKDVLDLIWVQGPGDTDTLTNSGTYNATTANYKWLHDTTGLKILAETSFAGSGAADRWSTTTAANINARIANGVIGVHVNSPSGSFQSAISGLSSLSSTCN